MTSVHTRLGWVGRVHRNRSHKTSPAPRQITIPLTEFFAQTARNRAFPNLLWNLQSPRSTDIQSGPRAEV